MAMKMDIWNEMMGLERRFDELVKDFLGPRARATFPQLPEGFRRAFIPTTDVFTRDGSMVIKLELPGIDPDKDLTITVEEDQLIVHGERRAEEKVEEKDYYRMETSYGSFERRFPLLERIGDEDVTATYKDGILEIVFPAPKGELEPTKKEVPVKKIEIKK